jgi:hypothetical protein
VVELAGLTVEASLQGMLQGAVCCNWAVPTQPTRLFIAHQAAAGGLAGVHKQCSEQQVMSLQAKHTP